jgi:nicotinamide mononucleotide adenylyltransferase
MKSFLEVLKEEESGGVHHVMTFGRMNPPTTGHLKVVDKVKEIAKKHGADHTVVVSHSQDAKKNPLSAEQKLKHLKRYSPDTHFEASSKEHPTFLQHAAKLHKSGVTHLHMVVGSDRVKEMHDKLHQYNGTHPGALYNFKKITVHSAGQRDPDAEGTEGMSGTKMREHAKNNDLGSFRKGVPSHVPEHHAKELMQDVRRGMGLHESYSHGRNKAIFVTGGPGSGKDVVIRECIASQNIVEHNFSQVIDILNDKHKLAMRSMNPRFESLRTRGPLIINGPADDLERVSQIKEELEELGYETMMIFVDTTNDVSKNRNEHLTKMVAESTRYSKWQKAQSNSVAFSELFENYVLFDNNMDLELKEEDITETYHKANQFLSGVDYSGINRFISIYESNKSAKAIQKTNLKSKGFKVLKDNNSPFMQAQRKLGQQDDVRDGDVKSNGTYTFRTYSEAKFNMDNDKEKVLKRGNTALTGAKIGRIDGVGGTYDTRIMGQGLTGGAGLGNQTYSEDTLDPEFSNAQPASGPKPRGNAFPNPLGEKKKLKGFKESLMSGETGYETGVSGTLSGAAKKEPIEMPSDRYIQAGITIKNKKNSGAK